MPNGHDPMTGTVYPPSETVFPTVVYRRFDAGWKHPESNAPPGSSNQDLIPGPLLRARVGDTILVHFKNMDTAFNRPHSMHFHGVHYRPSSDGSYIPGFSGRGADVKPGETYTYTLHAGSDSAGVWPYHDHSPSMDASIAGGMYGMLSILGPGERPPDREFEVVFAPMGQFMTIDGRAFLGNTPVFTSVVGQTVQWDVMAMGSDFHTFHVHGHRWIGPDGAPTDTQTVGPAESFSVRWREEDPGTWLYHCHVEEHMMTGHDRHLPRQSAVMRRSPRIGLAAAVAALAAVVGFPGLTAADQSGTGGPGSVSILYDSYAPGQTDVLVGDTVTWTNTSPRFHTVTADDGSWSSDRLVGGATFSYRFATTGAFTYYCKIHSSMQGEVDVHRVLLDKQPLPATQGHAFTLTGRAAPTQGGTVSIEADNGAGFQPLTSASVRDDGGFAATVTPQTTTTYRAVVDGEASPPVTLLVLNRSVTISRTALRGGRVLISAHVAPAAAGATVVLQFLLRERFGWWPVERALLSPTSNARFVVRRRPGVAARVLLTLPDGATPLATSRIVHLSG